MSAIAFRTVLQCISLTVLEVSNVLQWIYLLLKSLCISFWWSISKNNAMQTKSDFLTKITVWWIYTSTFDGTDTNCIFQYLLQSLVLEEYQIWMWRMSFDVIKWFYCNEIFSTTISKSGNLGQSTYFHFRIILVVYQNSKELKFMMLSSSDPLLKNIRYIFFAHLILRQTWYSINKYEIRLFIGTSINSQHLL